MEVCLTSIGQALQFPVGSSKDSLEGTASVNSNLDASHTNEHSCAKLEQLGTNGSHLGLSELRCCQTALPQGLHQYIGNGGTEGGRKFAVYS